MISFTIQDILFSVIAFMLFGFFHGALYKMFFIAFALLSYLGDLIKKLMLPTEKFLSSIKADVITAPESIIGVKKEIFDFLFYTCFGVSYITLVYIVQDGCFRIYGILISLLFFAIATRVLSSAESGISKALISLIKLTALIINVGLAPLKCLKRFFVYVLKRKKVQ